MTVLRRSAGYRIAFAYTAWSAFAVLLVGISIYLAAGAAMRRELDRTITAEMAVLHREYGEGGFPDMLDAIQRRAAHEGNPFRYVAVDRRGHVAVGGAMPAIAAGFSTVRLKDRRWRVARDRLPDGGQVAVAADMGDLDRLRGDILAILVAGFATLLVSGMAGALILGGHLRRRLASISSTAQAIIAGDLGQRVLVRSPADEFDRAGASINAMLERMSGLIDNLRQVSSDIAHDLRTPLQRMRGTIDAGLRQPGDAAAMTTTLAGLREQGDAMLSLFDAMLRISEIEAGAGSQRFAPLDLAAVAAGVAEMYAPAVQDSGRFLTTRIGNLPVMVHGDRELLIQALSNILDNAMSHTPQGIRITLAVDQDADDAILMVGDDGPGVPIEDRPRILQRFVRLNTSRNRPGFGLGLSLVSAIVSAHRGTIAIGDNEPGLRITLALPSHRHLPTPGLVLTRHRLSTVEFH